MKRNAALRSRSLRIGLATALLVASIDLVPRLVAARDFADILPYRRLFTPEAASAGSGAAAGPLFTYEQGLGFVLATPDRRFSIALGGYTQVRYTLTDVDDRYESASSGTRDSQTFDVPRSRFWLRGNAFSKKLFYKAEVDVATTGDGDALRDAEIGYDLIGDGWLTVKVGQFKTFYSRQDITSDAKLEFVDRALATSNFRFERARGIALYGAPLDSLIEYDAGVFNTTGRNGSSNPSGDFLYLMRIAVNPFGPVPYSEGDFGPTPLPLVSIGASYGIERTPASTFTTAATAGPDPNDPSMTILTSTGTVRNRVPYQAMIQPFYGKLQNPGQLTVGIQNLEVDLAARWLGADLGFEYFLGFNSTQFLAAAPPPPFALPPGSFDSRGYYVQAGYFLIPETLQIAARYSAITPNEKNVVELPDGTSEVASQDELLGAVGWYFAEHDLKIVTDFGPVNADGKKDAAGNFANRHDFRWRVQAQLVF